MQHHGFRIQHQQQLNSTVTTTKAGKQAMRLRHRRTQNSHRNTYSYDGWWHGSAKGFQIYALSIPRVSSLFAIDYRVNTFSSRTTTKQDGFLFLIRQFIICILFFKLKCYKKGRKCRKYIFYTLPCPSVAYTYHFGNSNWNNLSALYA